MTAIVPIKDNLTADLLAGTLEVFEDSRITTINIPNFFFSNFSFKKFHLPNLAEVKNVGHFNIENNNTLEEFICEKLNLDLAYDTIFMPFVNCSALKKLILPAMKKTPDMGLIGDCAHIEELDISGVEDLKGNAVGNSSITECDLSGVKTIYSSSEAPASWRDEPFWEMSSLRKVWIGANCTSIHGNIFRDCPNVSVYTPIASKPSGWDNNYNKDADSGRTITFHFGATKEEYEQA